MASFEDGDREEFTWAELHKLLQKTGDTITPLGAKDPGTPEMPAKTTLAETKKAMRSMVVIETAGGLIPETQLSPEGKNEDDPTDPNNFHYVLAPSPEKGDFLGAGIGTTLPPNAEMLAEDDAVPIEHFEEVRVFIFINLLLRFAYFICCW